MCLLTAQIENKIATDFYRDFRNRRHCCMQCALSQKLVTVRSLSVKDETTYARLTRVTDSIENGRCALVKPMNNRETSLWNDASTNRFYVNWASLKYKLYRREVDMLTLNRCQFIFASIIILAGVFIAFCLYLIANLISALLPLKFIQVNHLKQWLTVLSTTANKLSTRFT